MILIIGKYFIYFDCMRVSLAMLIYGSYIAGIDSGARDMNDQLQESRQHTTKNRTNDELYLELTLE